MIISLCFTIKKTFHPEGSTKIQLNLNMKDDIDPDEHVLFHINNQDLVVI